MKTNPACPTEETLVDFLENRLPAKERVQVERHLAQCAGCREIVVAYTGLEAADVAEQKVHVPRGVTERAVSAVLKHRDTVLPRTVAIKARRLMERGAAVLDRLFWQPGPQMALRGEPQADAPVIRREKRFGDWRVTIELERIDADRAEVRVTGDPGGAAAAVRVTVLKDGREAASGVLGQGAITFDEIPPGAYVLVFSLPDGEQGEYAFEIVDQPDKRMDETD